MRWIDGATKEDFPEVPYHELIELVGIEKTIAIATAFKKQSLYFGHIDSVESKIKRRYVVRQFADLVREMDPPRVYVRLARETDLAVATIYEIIRDDDQKKRQMKLKLEGA